ncbi:MAG: DNA repair helicase XPB [Thermoplasmata archaeon]
MGEDSERGSRPLVVQSDRTLLLETDSPVYEEVRDAILPFAEILKTPEYVHTYRISPLSLWNAASAGHTADRILEVLRRYGRYEVPAPLAAEIRETIDRFGRLVIEKGSDLSDLYLASSDRALLERLAARPEIAAFLDGRVGDRFHMVPLRRGHLKQHLVELGYPARDLAGYAPGAPVAVTLRTMTASAGAPFELRRYQKEAVASFLAGGTEPGGAGVLVLPCGAGKTLIGLGALAALQTSTLILCSSGTAVDQWVREIHERTSLAPDQVWAYTGTEKTIAPVTVTTYQILTHRTRPGGPLPHWDLFARHPWGFIIYDEVHLLPAPVFRLTAELQSCRRLGLTATLIREDGREGEVFALVGPKRYDVPWRELERQGWIAPAECHEIRVELDDALRAEYLAAPRRLLYPLAAKNPAKELLVRALVYQNPERRILVFGQYLDQLHRIAALLEAPLIDGTTRETERRLLYNRFRAGDLKLLVVSRVANYALDLPEADLAIQVSGTFGSRQEEAQRLGRLLRPKMDGRGATFYSVVSKDTVDQEFSLKRQLFLAEQGYRYSIEDLTVRPTAGGSPPPSVDQGIGGV